MVRLVVRHCSVIINLHLGVGLLRAGLFTIIVLHGLAVNVEAIVHARRPKLTNSSAIHERKVTHRQILHFFAYVHHLHVPMSEVRPCEAEVDSFDRIFHLAGCLLYRRCLLQVCHC